MPATWWWWLAAILACTCWGRELAHGIVLFSASLVVSSSLKVGVGLPVEPVGRGAAAVVSNLASGIGVENSLFSLKVKRVIPSVVTSLVVVTEEVTHLVSALGVSSPEMVITF